MTTKKVLDIGQCDFDHHQIRKLLISLGCDVVRANSAKDALNTLKTQKIDLALVNRVFDLDGGGGLDFISIIKADPALNFIPLMLVSNFEEAQIDAESRGALKGFGKSSIASPTTKELLKKAIS